MLSVPKETWRSNLNGFCKCTFIFEKKCDELVTKYFDIAYGIASVDLGPTMCAEFGVCQLPEKSHYIGQYVDEKNLQDALCENCKDYVPLIKYVNYLIFKSYLSFLTV